MAPNYQVVNLACTNLFYFSHSIGSLNVDYEVYGTSGLDNNTVEQEMKKSFTNDPRVQLQTESTSFGGSIDPNSQQTFSEYSLY